MKTMVVLIQKRIQDYTFWHKSQPIQKSKQRRITNESEVELYVAGQTFTEEVTQLTIKKQDK